MKVKLKKVRLSFPSLFIPKAIAGGDGMRYSAAFAIEPESENHKTLAEAIHKAASEKWGAKAAAILKDLKGKGRVGYREEPLANSEGEIYDGFEGMHALNASNKIRPLVIDRDLSPLAEDDGRPYAGCYVNVSLDCWAQDNQYGKRINFTLSGVQFAADGEAFGGGRPASPGDFEDEAEEDELI